MKVLAFDIGGTAIKHSLFTDGCPGIIRETPTEAALGGRHLMDTLAALALSYSGYDAIGISTAGQVNSETGVIIYANQNIPGYTGMRIKEELEDLTRVPVAVENDVNAAALGEAFYGAGKGHDSFLMLTYGTGVGGACIQNRRVYHGSSYSAGEFGAIITHSEDRLSGSDYYDGGYEKYASASALVRLALSLDPTLDTGRKIFAAVDRPEVARILDRWVDEIMLGLASLTHIFNPSCIILGGGVMEQPLVLEKINAKKSRFFMPSFAHVELRRAGLGNTAGLLGACHLATDLLLINTG